MKQTRRKTEENKLVEVLLRRYHHFLGPDEKENLTTEKIVEAIIKYYEYIIGCMPGNVYWLEVTGHGIGCNKNVLNMFGFDTVSEFTGLSFEDMGRIGNWGPAADSFKNDTLEVVRTRQPKLNVEEPVIPNGTGRATYFLTNRVPLFDSTGNVIAVVGISTDITELKYTQLALKKAKEEAEAASQAKTDFLSNMSHDIKTPLSGIVGVSELLTYRLSGEDRELADTLLMSGRQLLTFIENCLEASKLENNDTGLSENFQLKQVIDEIEELFQPAVKTKELELKVVYDRNIPMYLKGNRAGVYRILLNLVGNAVKFTQKGSVSIRIMQNKKIVKNEMVIQFIVEDTGIGIPKEKQKIIFDRFTRLTPSYKGIYEGSGIGLYIVKKFVNAMGGEIFLQSEQDKGSRFKITLPFQVPSQVDKQPPKSNKLQHHAFQIPQENLPKKLSVRSQSHKKHKCPLVLLVEDNIVAQRMESSLLSSMGCQVEIAESGEKALEIFEPGKYDLIFMDIGLPGLQGDAVSKLLRKIELGTNHHVPIIALTAHCTDEIIKQYLAFGMEGVFSKPLSRVQAKQLIDCYCIEKLSSQGLD